MWGPLPGIILAATMGTLAYFQLMPTFFDGIMFQLIFMLLIINYFNPLPILPQDIYSHYYNAYQKAQHSAINEQ